MSLPVKVSVIVPIYNVEEYLPKCLDSCINQTLYDIEIICVNDGSTDGSEKILNEYAKIDRRIKIVSKENSGLSSARNVGIHEASGEWIMFLDSDDFLSPTACERVWIESQEATTDIIVFGSNIYPANPTPPTWYSDTLHIKTKRYFGFKPEILFKEPGAKPFVWRQAFSKDFLNRFSLSFDQTVKYGEDIIFQFTAFPLAENVSFISNRLYNYRWQRSGSLMESVDRKSGERIEQHLSLIDRILDYWTRHGITEKYGVYTLDWVLEFIVNELIEDDYEKKSEYAARLRDSIKKYGLERYKNDLWPDRAYLYKRLRSM